MKGIRLGGLAMLGCLLAACARTPVAVADTLALRQLADRMAKRPHLTVLFVGNSYSFGVPRALEKLGARAGRDIEAGRAASNGWTLARHATDANTLRAIRGRHWDIVVFQEQSAIPARSPRTCAAAMFKPLEALVAEARAVGALPVLFQTWGYRNGQPSWRGDSFDAMTDRLRAGYLRAAHAAGDLPVIPVGDAWQHRVAAGQADALFLPDGRHPTTAGNQLTASVFLQAFSTASAPIP